MNNIFHFLSSLDVFVIGRVFGAHSLGLYKVASEIASLPSSELVAPIQRAIYPGFAKLAHDLERLRRAYIEGIAILVMLAVPAATGIAMLADPIVRVLLGANWLEAIPLLQVLSLNGIIRLAGANTSSVFIATGRPYVTSYLALTHLLLLGPVLAAGIYFGGLVGATWALVVISCVGLCLSYGIALRALSIPVRRLLAAVWRSWVAAGIMALILSVLLQWSSSLFAVPIVDLLIAVPAGAAAYCGTHLAIWRIMGRPRGAEELALAFVASFRRTGVPSEAPAGPA